MIKSLAIKVGMLATTILLVMWIGWPAPHDVVPVAAVPLRDAERHETDLQRQEPTTVARPAQPVTSAVPRVGKLQPKNGKLDLNRATAEELQNLPGIGPVLAQRVIDQRTAHGLFNTVDDLKDVKGIGKKRMDQLRPLVMVGMTTQAEPKRDMKNAKGL
jgi:competence protein ComEA